MEYLNDPGLKMDRLAAESAMHIGLLNDSYRTQTFLDAISKAVKPGDVVVEVGCGIGLLSIAAAKAGAKHVYAIEASDIAHVAREMFKNNGVEDKITLIHAWSTDVELPEKADVFISEMIGNDPFAEEILQVASDAKKRLMKEDAVYIPEAIRLYGVPVSIPQAQLTKRTFDSNTLKKWKKDFSYNFEALAPIRGIPESAFYVKPQNIKTWQTFGEPIKLVDVTMHEGKGCVPPVSTKMTPIKESACNGFVLHFEVIVGDGNTITTQPQTVADSNHWRIPVYTLDKTQAFIKNQTWNLTYSFMGGVSHFSVK
jgi:protein arginine N-methyltransferase 1